MEIIVKAIDGDLVI